MVGQEQQVLMYHVLLVPQVKSNLLTVWIDFSPSCNYGKDSNNFCLQAMLFGKMKIPYFVFQ